MKLHTRSPPAGWFRLPDKTFILFLFCQSSFLLIEKNSPLGGMGDCSSPCSFLKATHIERKEVKHMELKP